jgi:hypothetical protein
MCKTIQLPAVKPVPTKMLLRHEELERFDTAPYFLFNENTSAFIKCYPPGKLAKDLYKLIFALMEHQGNNQQPVNFATSIYDIKQLLQLLEEADRIQQIGKEYGKSSNTFFVEDQRFLEMATEFMYENNPINLSCNLCRVILDFIRYELQIGYPTYINEFLPDVLALLEWLYEGASLLKLKPPKKLVSE